MLRAILWKLLRSNTLIIVSTVISFVIGLLLRTAISQALSSQGNYTDIIVQGSVSIVLILILIYISLQFKDIRGLIQKQKLSVGVSYSSEKEHDRQVYGPLIEAIATANKSIRAVGMFRSSDAPHKEGRKSYYDVIREVIDLKTSLNQPFIYERIVQVEQVRPGVLHRQQIDPIMLKHCEQMLNWNSQRNSVSVHLKQMPNILGALSLVIIDDDKFMLAIPDISRTNGGTLKLEGLKVRFIFEDPDNVLTEPMKGFFSRIFNESDTIKKIED